MQSIYRRFLSVLALTFPPSHPRRIHIYGEGLRSMVQVKNINSKYIHWVTNFPAIVQYILWGRQTTVRACYLCVQRLKNIVMYKCSYFNTRKHCCTFKHRDFSPLTLLSFSFYKVRETKIWQLWQGLRNATFHLQISMSLDLLTTFWWCVKYQIWNAWRISQMQGCSQVSPHLGESISLRAARATGFVCVIR